MGSSLLLVALLQGTPAPAPRTLQTLHVSDARFSVGGEAMGIGVTSSAWSGQGWGSGFQLSGRLGPKDNVDARITHLLPGGGLGFYELRWRRTVRSTQVGRTYAGAGIVGFYERTTTGYPVRRSHRRLYRPQVLSGVFGTEQAVGSHVILPVEISVYGHYRALGVAVSAGLKWTPSRVR